MIRKVYEPLSSINRGTIFNVYKSFAFKQRRNPKHGPGTNHVFLNWHNIHTKPCANHLPSTETQTCAKSTGHVMHRSQRRKYISYVKLNYFLSIYDSREHLSVGLLFCTACCEYFVCFCPTCPPKPASPRGSGLLRGYVLGCGAERGLFLQSITARCSADCGRVL